MQNPDESHDQQANHPVDNRASARERQLLVQYAVTRVLAEAPSVDAAMPAILRAIAEHLDWDVADFWRLDADAQVLRCVEIWHPPGPAFDTFARATRQHLFEPGTGLPGRVWSSGAPTWISDLAGDANFPRAEAAAHDALRSAFAFPIRLGDSIFGVMEFFSRQARDPESDLLPVFDALGSQIGQFIERKRVEEELHRSRDQLALILQSVADGITVTRPDGGILYANDGAARMLDFPSAEALRATPVSEIFARFEILDESGAPLPLDRLPSRLAYAGAENPSALVRFRVKATGEERWSIVRARTVRDAQGQVRFAVNIFHDVTDRLHVEEALRVSTANQRFLAEASILLASSLDYEMTLARAVRLALPQLADWCYVDISEDDGTIRRVGAAHADPAKDGLAQQLCLYPPDPHGSHTVVQVLRTGRPAIVSDVSDEHLIANTRDAEHLRIVQELGLKSYMTVPLTARGRSLGAITFLAATAARRYGPTDLALAEDLARRAALAVDNARLYREAQDAIRVRDEFVSVAAHELKTPITGLRGYAQLLARQMDKDRTLEPERVRRALQVIDHQSEKLAQLISQLLDISRLEAGRLSLERQVVDVRAMVEGVALAAQAHAEQHMVTVEAPIWVRALIDPLRVEQVVTNLVNNAVKFSPAGGPVDILVEVPAPDSLRIAVRDRGIGIAPEHRAHIFDRFYQAHGNGRFGGMGLGLYISRQIVELHGGHIEAEFPADGGTRFVVLLPTGLNAEARPTPAEDGWQPA